MEIIIRLVFVFLEIISRFIIVIYFYYRSIINFIPGIINICIIINGIIINSLIISITIFIIII